MKFYCATILIILNFILSFGFASETTYEVLEKSVYTPKYPPFLNPVPTEEQQEDVICECIGLISGQNDSLEVFHQFQYFDVHFDKASDYCARVSENNNWDYQDIRVQCLNEF